MEQPSEKEIPLLNIYAKELKSVSQRGLIESFYYNRYEIVLRPRLIYWMIDNGVKSNTGCGKGHNLTW